MHKHKAFTLVELLIVIVVIAVLAAISVVAYNGIKQRAYNASVESAASNALKVIQLAYISEGQIALNSGIPNGGYAWCIANPADLPATSIFAAGQCHTNYTGAWASQELWDSYSQYADGDLTVGQLDFGGSTYSRGVLYIENASISTSEVNDFLYYVLKGSDQTCSLPGTEPVDDRSTFNNGPNTTSCWINLDDLLGEAPLVW